MDPKTYEAPAPLLATIPQVPLLPQHIITSGTRKDCVRLRGLPYEAQVEHILEFLGEHAKNIVFQGVHMVYNAQVRHYTRQHWIDNIIIRSLLHRVSRRARHSFKWTEKVLPTLARPSVTIVI